MYVIHTETNIVYHKRDVRFRGLSVYHVDTSKRFLFCFVVVFYEGGHF